MTRKVEVQRQHPPLECATEFALPALVPLPIDDLERHILVRRSGALGVLDTISVIYYVKFALNIIITIDTLFETGSEAYTEMTELDCCPTEPEKPSIICPIGATAGDDYAPSEYTSSWTCAELIDYAKLFETESAYCGVIGEEDKSYCCPAVTSAPTPMPVNDTTVATTMTSSNVTPSPVETLTTSPRQNNSWCPQHQPKTCQHSQTICHG